MARITRKTQKIFALDATNNGQFGSAQTGAKVLDDDPDIIQALDAWVEGWLSAVIGAQKLPPLEEMQGIQYVITRQLSYILQEGIPEFDVGTTYYTNSIVKKSGTYQLYGSIVDNNTGNALTDPTKWKMLIDFEAQYASDAEAFAASISNKALVPSNFGQKSFSTYGTPGYQKLPGGLIIQFGQATTNGAGQVAVTWPITFPNALIAAFQTDIAMGATGAACNIVSMDVAPTTSGATFYAITNAGGVVGTPFNYLAIGC